jgi:hypothetical protein
MSQELSGHVTYHMVVRSYPGRPDLGGDFDSYVPKDAAGVKELWEAGYRPVEIAITDEQGRETTEIRYLQSSGDLYEPGDYENYLSLLQAQEAQASREAAARMNELAEGPRAHGRTASAQKAIVNTTVVPVAIVAGEDSDRELPEFQAKMIDGKEPFAARKDADAILRSQGLVPGRIQGDPNTYYMSELQWEAYRRSVAESIYTD